MATPGAQATWGAADAEPNPTPSLRLGSLFRSDTGIREGDELRLRPVVFYSLSHHRVQHMFWKDIDCTCVVRSLTYLLDKLDSFSLAVVCKCFATAQTDEAQRYIYVWKSRGAGEYAMFTVSCITWVIPIHAKVLFDSIGIVEIWNVKVQCIPEDSEGHPDLEILDAQLQRHSAARLLLAIFPAASAATGALTDVAALCKALHRRGALAAIDFATPRAPAAAIAAAGCLHETSHSCPDAAIVSAGALAGKSEAAYALVYCQAGIAESTMVAPPLPSGAPPPPQLHQLANNSNLARYYSETSSMYKLICATSSGILVVISARVLLAESFMQEPSPFRTLSYDGPVHHMPVPKPPLPPPHPTSAAIASAHYILDCHASTDMEAVNELCSAYAERARTVWGLCPAVVMIGPEAGRGATAKITAGVPPRSAADLNALVTADDVDIDQLVSISELPSPTHQGKQGKGGKTAGGQFWGENMHGELNSRMAELLEGQLAEENAEGAVSGPAAQLIAGSKSGSSTVSFCVVARCGKLALSNDQDEMKSPGCALFASVGPIHHPQFWAQLTAGYFAPLYERQVSRYSTAPGCSEEDSGKRTCWHDLVSQWL